MIKKTFILLALVVFIKTAFSQQYPWWTQYRSNQPLVNPAFCGTKRLIDIRINYRNQWTGYDGSPKTYALALNSRLWKGRLGVGGFLFRDDIGPFNTTNGSLTGAYHLKFEDSELSFGVQGNYMQTKFNGDFITLRNQQDFIINKFKSNSASTFDGSFGLVYYNDRFHLGIGANNISGGKMGYYTNVPHYNISAGFNWADDPNYTFENSVLAVYIPGIPVSVDYTLRFHMKKQLIAGFSFRLKDAIALHLGYTIKDNLQICYSYDIITSPLRKYQSGSHEISIVFSSMMGTDSRRRGLDRRFIKQKYPYLL